MMKFIYICKRGKSPTSVKISIARGGGRIGIERFYRNPTEASLERIDKIVDREPFEHKHTILDPDFLGVAFDAYYHCHWLRGHDKKRLVSPYDNLLAIADPYDEEESEAEYIDYHS